MKHVKVLGIKWVVVLVIVLSLFGIFDHMPLENLLWMSLLITVFSYVLGDMIFYRYFGNIMALILDFALAFVLFWYLGNLFIGAEYAIVPIAFFSAFFFLCSELFIHGYLSHLFAKTYQKESRDMKALQKLRVEFAEESDIQPPIDKENE
ncbi:signal transduction histidine kinase [Cerasibacillus quisquiliarum]|uniref:Membrane protein YndM n=1 Tax=Cerasibacillus quisquiliarum TaxID=227865 RepID=A0A511V141_9BACI|nr:DUF2512 family protein [Cerasibacillus quisquiliarum]MBB5146867.1 signal transduction histidine kinase [Cerasibacillus quisquiliarum]GEN31638.1 hypothetical protein CQU01_18760 [Cerasibacillus quisquiliarum]